MAQHERINGRVIVGLTENVRITASDSSVEEIMAKVDTGATKSSIDTRLATKLSLGPVIRSKIVKSAHGNQLRPLIEAEIFLAGKKIKAEFTLADRTHMKYKVLIGVNILADGFLVDPSKK